MASIKFDITGNANGFVNATRQAEAASGAMTRNIEREGNSLDSMFKTLAGSAAAFFSISQANALVNKIRDVRSEFQQLEIAFGTMLQSEEKGSALIMQLTDTAARTPFDLLGIANSAKQLLAYGVAADEVNDTIVRLGNVAAGLSIPLNDLAYLYGTTMTQGRLFTQDLRQFQGRGIPIADELAKQFGVAKEAVGQLVTEGRVGFPEVKKAIEAMTNEGGKFFQLMEKQSASLGGMKSNLEDQFDMMFNEIGQKMQGTIASGIQFSSTLIEHYEEIGKALAHIVAGYGLYKAAVVAISAVSKAQYAAEMSQLSSLLPVKQASLNADIESAVAAGHITKEKAAEIVAIRAEAAAHVQNLKAIAEEAGAKAVAALTAKSANAEEIAALQIKAIALRESGKSRQADALQMQIQSLQIKQKTLSEAAETAVTEANTARQRANTAATELDTISTKKNTLATNLLTAAKAKLAAVSTALKAALTNPYVLAGAAVVGLVAAVWSLNKALDYEEQAHKNVAKALEEQNTRLEEQKAKAEELMHTISDEASTEMQRVQALEELRKLYPNLFKDMSDQEIKTLSQVEATKKLAEETERLREEELKRMIQQKKESLTETKAVDVYGMYGIKTGTMEVGPTKQYIETTKNEIKELEGELAELRRLREQAEFNAKPKQLQIVSLQEQIDKLKAENAELDAQIASAVAKKWTINELGNLDYDWGAGNSADALIAQREANKASLAQFQEKLENIKKATTVKPTEDPSKNKEHKAITLIKQQEADLKAQRKLSDLQHQARMAQIKTEKDDRERERLMREEENERELEDIKRQKEDYINALVRAQVEALVAKKTKNINVAAIRKEIESGADIKLFDDIYNDTVTTQTNDSEKNKKDKENSDRREYLREYGTFEEKKLAITEEYAEKINKAENDWEKKRLERERDKALSDIENSYNVAYQNIFKDPQKMTDAAIGDAILLARSKIAEINKKASLSNEDMSNIKELQEAIDKLEGARESKPFSNLGSGLEGVIDKLREINSLQKKIDNAKERGDNRAIEEYEKELEAIKENLKSNIAGLVMSGTASALNTIADSLRKISEITGELHLDKIASQLEGFGSTINTVMQGLASGGPLGALGAIIGKGIKDMIAQFQMFFEYAAINTKALENYASAIEGLELKLDLEKFDTIFGENKWSKIAEISDTLRRNLDAIDGMRFTAIDRWKSVTGEEVRKVFGANADETYGLSEYWVQAKGARSKKNSGTLAQLFGADLFDENGNIRVDKIDKAKAALESLQDMKLVDDGAIKALEKGIEYAENVKEAGDALKQAASDYLGSLSQEIGDALVNSILKGEDALESFGDTAAEIIIQMGKDLAATWALENYLKTFEADMISAFDSGDANAVSKVISDIVNDLPLVLSAGTEMVQGFFDAAKQQGIDVYEYANESNRSSVSKGIAQASQDSIDEVNGKITNIQSHTFSINQQMASVVNLTTQILARVTSIDGNTARLREIEDSLKFMKEDISTIATRGITMR